MFTPIVIRCVADINECLSGSGSASICHDRADCVNTNGGFNCSCVIGYRGDGFESCVGKFDADNETLTICSGEKNSKKSFSFFVDLSLLRTAFSSAILATNSKEKIENDV